MERCNSTEINGRKKKSVYMRSCGSYMKKVIILYIINEFIVRQKTALVIKMFLRFGDSDSGMYAQLHGKILWKERNSRSETIAMEWNVSLVSSITCRLGQSKYYILYVTHHTHAQNPFLWRAKIQFQFSFWPLTMFMVFERMHVFELSVCCCCCCRRFRKRKKIL